MRLILFVTTFFFVSSTFAEPTNSIQYVARYAMQTAKSKNFKELAENLFQNPIEREEALAFIKRHGLLKRSLPDIIAEGPQIMIKERSKNTSLDFSGIESLKLMFNGQQITFTGKEKYAEIYSLFKKIQSQKKASGILTFFLSEAEADLPILAVVTLTTYAKASITSRTEEISAEAAALAAKQKPHKVLRSTATKSN